MDEAEQRMLIGSLQKRVHEFERDLDKKRKEQSAAATTGADAPVEEEDAGHVAVVFVHGINTRSLGFSKGLQQAVMKRLKGWSRYVEFQEVFWAQVVRGNQDIYMNRSRSAGALPRQTWRSSPRDWVVNGLSDAASYQKVINDRSTAYWQVQREVSAIMDKLADPKRPKKTLILVGHSFGCHILSTFIWDTYRDWEHLKAGSQPERGIEEFHAYRRVKRDRPGLTINPDMDKAFPFRMMRTLGGVLTFGNNMPLFTFMYPNRAVFPTRYGEEVDLPTNLDVKWINMYSRHDLLGYPLRPLNAEYAERITDDVELKRVGATFWPPYKWPVRFALSHTIWSHMHYWTHPGVTYTLTQMILEAIGPKTQKDANRYKPPRRRWLIKEVLDSDHAPRRWPRKNKGFKEWPVFRRPAKDAAASSKQPQSRNRSGA